MTLKTATELEVTAYAIGVDFGTESGRALLLDLAGGDEVAVAEVAYPHGVIEERLPETGEPLPNDWALQDPDDYVHVITTAVPEVLRISGVPPASVIGLGVDFTSCTVLPVSRAGVPLCSSPPWRVRRHAWPKLWKHHAAQAVADHLNEVGRQRHEPFLDRYGGKLSSEWYFPKLIELWLEDREVYDAADGFVEGTDWIVWWLTGNERRATCSAGYKACWSPEDGLPPTAFFESAYPGFSDPAAKLGSSFYPLGSPAGTLSPRSAAKLGLPADVVVAVGNVDSFVSPPGAGVSEPATYVMVVGTSICDLVVHRDEVLMPGITGVMRDGILPGMFGYEAGQAAVGDMLAWFVRELDRGGSQDRYPELERAAAKLRPGGSGLVVLDWWNGNRSILADADLSGVIAGLTLQTGPDQIYRALLESIAFGNRRIIDNFEEHGLGLGEIVACGGIAEKSPLLMQMIADVARRPVRVPASSQVPARGAALFGAVAAGPEAGGFADIGTAIEATAPPAARSFRPDEAAGETYERVYRIYRQLYDAFGDTHAGLVHELKRIASEA